MALKCGFVKQRPSLLRQVPVKVEIFSECVTDCCGPLRRHQLGRWLWSRPAVAHGEPRPRPAPGAPPGHTLWGTHWELVEGFPLKFYYCNIHYHNRKIFTRLRGETEFEFFLLSYHSGFWQPWVRNTLKNTFPSIIPGYGFCKQKQTKSTKCPPNKNPPINSLSFTYKAHMISE